MRGEVRRIGVEYRPAFAVRVGTASGENVGEEDFMVTWPSGAGNYISIFPLAADFPGRVLALKKTAGGFDGNVITAQRTGGDSIEGLTAFSFTALNRTVWFQSDGISEWRVIADYIASGLSSQWVDFLISATDFTAAANSETINIWTMPAGTKIQNAVLVPEIVFAAGGLTGYKMKIGILAHLHRYMNLFDLFVAPSPSNFGFTAGPWLESIGNAVIIRATAQSTGNTLNNVNLGAVRLYFEVSNILGTSLP